VVVALVAPGAVHGHAGFPVAAGRAGGGDALLRRAQVARVAAAEAVVRDDARLEIEQGQQHLGPLLGHVGRRVPPEHRELAVVREDLAHLRDGDVAKVRVHVTILSRVPVAAGRRAARVVPVLRLRVVEAEAQAVLAAGLGQRRQQVLAVRRRVHHVPVRRLRVEQREAVVVFRRDHDILHARLFRQPHPRVRIVLDRVELPGERLVLRHRDLAPVHDPFPDPANLLPFVRPRRHGIHAPVNKQAEAGFAPPLHAGVALLGSLVGAADDFGRCGRRGQAEAQCDGAEQAQ